MSAADEIIKTVQYALERYTVNCDRTFVSVIKSVNGDGTYTIQDQSGADRKVKCCIPGAALTAGKNVWVKIPCNDIKKMHICGIK